MLNSILTLSKELISLQSIPANKEALEKCLDLCLSQLEGFTIERFETEGVKSALIYNTKERPEKFKIILNGHLDVIPGKDYQYKPKIVENRLYGAGAMDMKSNVACLITAFKEVANKVTYPLGLQLVTDEEIGGFKGTKYQIDQGVRADFVIAGETTNFNIVNKAKGILWLKISSTGKTAHSAYPWKGDNTIWKMNEFLNDLKAKYPIPTEQQWITTVNLSRIETTNQTFNKIPDDCEVWLDIRYIPEDAETIYKNIQEILPIGCTITIVEKEPPLFVKETNPYIQTLKSIDEQITKNKVSLYGAQGSSDARHYALVDGDGIEFGPIGGGIGSDEEWIDIPSLETYTHILKEFLIRLSLS